MFLSSRELESALADDRLESLLEGIDEFKNLRFPADVLQFFIGCGRLNIAEIICNGVVEERAVLEDLSEHTPVGREWNITDIHAVHGNGSSVVRIQSGDQVRHGGLSGPGVSDERDFPALAEDHRHILEDLAFRIRVAEADMVEDDALVEIGLFGLSGIRILFHGDDLFRFSEMGEMGKHRFHCPECASDVTVELRIDGNEEEEVSE